MTANSTDKYGKDWNSVLVYDPESPSGLVWKEDRYRGFKSKPYVFRKKGDVAGYLTPSGYWILCIQSFSKKTLFQLHRVVYEMHYGPIEDKTLVIDHIDGNKQNNRIENLRLITRKENTRNAIKYSNNTTGMVGVYFDTKSYCNNTKFKTYYKVCYQDLFGKQHTKCFSIDKFGKDEAFRLACEYRKQMVEELNKQGAGYTDRHGT